MAEFKFKDTSLSFDERAEALIKELTLDEKLQLICSHQGEIPRLGIKEMYIGAEVARGLVCRSDKWGEAPTTVFPEPFGLAATFDPEVMKAMGEITAVETRIYNKKGKTSLCVWGPTVDAERDPRWGRTEEAYGEDPFLIGEMSTAYTKAMCGDNDKYTRVIPTLKHFYANNHEESRGHDNASIPISLKHDYYLKAFEASIKSGGAKSLMTAYNEVNGVECICNPEVDEICKQKWGLLFSVTDGGDFIQNVTFHKHDHDHTEAIARVYRNHGADVMTDDEELVRRYAKEAFEKGLLTQADIDKAIFGVIKARLMLGEFDKIKEFDYPESMLCSEANYSASEKAAIESVILLRNSKGVLPFSDSGKVAVVGVAADMNFRDWYTGLSDRSGTILDSITAYLGRDNVMYDSGNDVIALRNASTGFYFSVNEDGKLVCDSALITEGCLLELYEWGENAVSFRSRLNGKFLADRGVMTCDSDEPYGWFVKEKFTLERSGRNCILRNWQGRYLAINEKGEVYVSSELKPGKNSIFNVELFSYGEERVKRIATEAHNVVMFGGNNPQINAREDRDRKSLELPEKQQRLLDAVLSRNENAALFLVSGFPYALHDSRLSAVLHISHAGPAMGAAVVKTLFGEVSPAGRCPMTWYTSDSELCDIKDYNIIRTKSTYQYYDGKPLFPFGHGLTYTGFRYGALSANKPSYTPDDTVEISLEVQNVGNFSSDEVVQLYVAPPKMEKALPIKQLKAFKRVHIPKGKKVIVTLSFKVCDLAFWDITADDFVVYGGVYEVQVGASSADIRRTLDIHIAAPEFEGIDTTKPVPAAASTNYVGVEYLSDMELNSYALIEDWQSFISYRGCRLNGKSRIEIVAANPGSRTTLNVSCEQNGVGVASIEIPSTGSFDSFVTLTADAKALDGIFTLRMTAGGLVCLKSFRFV